MICIPKNTEQFKQLKEKSGLNEIILQAFCGGYMEKYGRFPYLDELPNANSERYLRSTLKMNNKESVKIADLLNNRQTDTVEDAVRSINNDHLDLEVKILPMENDALVEITHRPTISNMHVEQIDVDESPNDKMVFISMIDKLAELYGIQINRTTNREILNSDQEMKSEFLASKAFVKDGQIYVNVDKASVDAPLHEMMHILIGSMRFTNPALYDNIVRSVEQFDNYDRFVKNLPGRTRNDVNEEIFVSEVSNYLSGLPSHIGGMDSRIQHEIMYNVNRILDTILMGQDSVKTIKDPLLFRKSLKELAKMVNSTVMNNDFKGFFNQEDSSLHRRLNNIKSELIKNKLLQEVCD